MAIKNYTTEIDVYQSLGEIQGALAKHGASKIMVDYEDGRPVGVSFALQTARGVQGFSLPVVVDGVMRVFERQKIRSGKEQAERTAWRNVRDWVLAQMALIESCDMPVDEPFLPYLSDGKGNTVYSLYSQGCLMLGDGGGQ